MILWPRTLTGRFLALTIGAVFLAQAIVLLLLFVDTDNRIAQYEDDQILGRIVSIYQFSSQVDATSRQRILEIASDLDVTFEAASSARGKPPAEDDLMSLRAFTELPDVPVFVGFGQASFPEILMMWVNGRLDQCLLLKGQPLIEAECPYWQTSLQYPDKTWMTVTSLAFDGFSVALIPLSISVLLTLTGTTLVLIFLTRRITAPLRSIKEAADKIGRGEDVPALPEGGPLELSSVIVALNTMQERISRFVQDRTMMLAAISHDLRTPITSLRLRAEFIEDQGLKDNIVESLDDMQVMVESFLQFARQDASSDPHQDIDLVAMCQRLADQTERVTFSTSQPDCWVVGPKSGMKRVLNNLVSNAVKYGKEAQVHLECDAKDICITIDDGGPGIPEKHFEDVFAPFARLDQARSVAEGSVGLGLSIARSIMRKQGGDIRPQTLTDGFRMIITLPREQSE